MKKIIFFITFMIHANLVLTQDLTQYVDPKIGVIGNGNCVIGPQLPFGSINPSPDTPNGSADGYHPDRKIRGFSQLHVTGTGGPGKYGQLLLSPQIGLRIGEEDHDSEKSEEESRLDYYKVRLLDYDILCEFSPTEHSAIYRFTFPKSDSAYILIDLGHNIPGDIAQRAGVYRGGYAENGAVMIKKDFDRITGWGTYWGGWSAEPFTVHFKMEFSKPCEKYGTWKNELISFNKDSEKIDRKAERIGAFVNFKTKKDEHILVKISVSMKSIDNASGYLKKEIPDWDFAKVQLQTKNEWNQHLKKIVISGADEIQKKIFYSSLYQCMRMPRNRTGDNPKWDSNLPYWDDQYCIWDTWKTAFPLNLLINENIVRDNILSFIDRYEHNGQVLDAFIAGNDRVYQWSRVEYPYYFHNQGGDDVDNVIADAYVKGVEGIDWQRAYQVVKFNAEKMRTPSYLIKDRGWIPFRTYEYAFDCSRSLEFAYNDFCSAQVAKSLHEQQDYQRYLSRSRQWIYLWNDTLKSDGFQGFICPKQINNEWLAYDPKSSGVSNSPGDFDRSFYEGNSWIYSYFVPHDFYKLIDLMGGQEIFVKRLQHALESDVIDFGNEPSFLTPFSFIYAGRPDLTSHWVRHNIKNYSLDGFPGDEDSGAMGSWFVFAALGFFPNAGQNIYLINGPLFPHATITRENGKKIIIEAKNVSNENTYVQSVEFNGKPLNRAWIKHEEIANGATLKFKMGSKPSDWGKEILPLAIF